MGETPFAKMAHLGEQLERTTKRLELAALLAEFLRGLSPEEIPPAVHLTQSPTRLVTTVSLVLLKLLAPLPSPGSRIARPSSP